LGFFKNPGFSEACYQISTFYAILFSSYKAQRHREIIKACDLDLMLQNVSLMIIHVLHTANELVKSVGLVF